MYDCISICFFLFVQQRRLTFLGCRQQKNGRTVFRVGLFFNPFSSYILHVLILWDTCIVFHSDAVRLKSFRAKTRKKLGRGRPGGVLYRFNITRPRNYLILCYYFMLCPIFPISKLAPGASARAVSKRRQNWMRPVGSWASVLNFRDFDRIFID
jgi:hypothetical protein